VIYSVSSALAAFGGKRGMAPVLASKVLTLGGLVWFPRAGGGLAGGPGPSIRTRVAAARPDCHKTVIFMGVVPPCVVQSSKP
jgi:hypothetical protein